MVEDSILERIRKVQGYLASDNPAEAAVAAAKLSELLIRHNLSMSDIPTEDRTRDDPWINSATDLDGSKKLTDWRITLGAAIARANLCKVIISGSHLQWLGRTSNVEVAQYIYETCGNDLQRIADGMWYAIRDLLRQNGQESSVNGRTWKSTFLMGAAVGVKQKLEDEHKSWQQSDVKITALIVTNDRELSDFVHSEYPRLGYSNRSSGYAQGGNAFGLGVATGKSMSFRQGIGAGGGSAQRRIGG